jgi:gamma-glutamyltranspeptidase/glutathione hydrolase
VPPQLKALLLALSLWSNLPAAAAPISRDDPESSDPNSRGISTARGSAVVVTANPLASTAALVALKNGGTAIDAGWQGAADPRREGTALALP